MITFIEKVLSQELPHMLGESEGPRSYLKLCTPTSGKTLNDKVIFLVFNANAPYPFLCVKTVRHPGAGEVILQNFKNLQMLNSLTSHSSFAHLFSQALYVHDDGEHVFCIESACPGTKIEPNGGNLQRVINAYTELAVHVAQRHIESIMDVKAYAQQLIEDSKLSSENEERLMRYIETLSFPHSLPRIPQHGDLTFDNVLESSEGLCFVDYDFAHITDVPGFDVYGLCQRYYKRKAGVSNACKKHVIAYFGRLGLSISDSEYRALCFLYHVIEHIKRKPQVSGHISIEKMISDFEFIHAL